MNTLRVSVVIPCFNAEATLARQLEALVRQDRAPWEVIVADNGSTDGSVALARSFADRLPRLTVVDASARRGAAQARNAGAATASGDVLAFCDADDEVAPGWIAGLVKALGQYDFVASRFDHMKLNPGNRYVHPQASGLNRDPNFDFLPRAGGCGLAIRREIHLRVGGFDENIRFHEDTDYCWKVQLAGTPLGYAPEAVVHVQLLASQADRFRKARRWAASEVAVYRKYRPLGMPAIPNGPALREWLRLARWSVRALLRRPVPRDFTWRLGTRLGRLQGSIVCATLLL